MEEKNRPRNRALVRLRKSFGMSVRKFSRFIKMAEQTYCAYETGRLYPTPKDAHYLAEIAGCGAHELFPMDAWRGSENLWNPRVLVGEDGLPDDCLLSLEDPAAQELPCPNDIEELVRKSIVAEMLRVEIKRLPVPARKMLRARFGIHGMNEHTLQEIAAGFDITKNGVKYVINRNLRTLRQRLSTVRELA